MVKKERRPDFADRLKPSAVPGGHDILPLLQDFPGIWRRMKLEAQRAHLQTMFGGLFFDGQGRLRWVLAHSPFDRLLGLPEGGGAIAGSAPDV